MAEPMVSHDCVAFYLLVRRRSPSRSRSCSPGRARTRCFAGYSWYPPLAGVPRERGRGGVREGLHRPPARRARRHPGARLAARRRPQPRRSSATHFAMPGADTTLDAALRLDSTIMLVDDPVKRVDNMTMAWGLEARVPFLDHELVELAAACPPELKLAHGGKGVLKEAARGNVPGRGHRPAQGILPGAGDPPPRGPVPRPRARRRDRPRRPRRAGWSAATGSRPCSRTRTPHVPTSARTRSGRSRCWRCGCRRGGSDLVQAQGGAHGARSADERRGDRGRLRPPAPPGPAVARSTIRPCSRRPTARPSPPPTGRMLAWISDRDGRPRAWVAPLPPDGSPVVEPAWPLPTHGDGDGGPACPGTSSSSPGRRTGTGWPASSPPAGASGPASGSSPRTAARSTDLAPERPGGHAGRLVARAGASWASRSSAPTAATGWPAWSTCATARRRCSPPAPPRWSARSAATACARSSASGGAAPAGWSMFDLRSGRCTELLPGGDANVADARFGDHRWPAVRALRRRGERPALLAVGLNGDAEPSLPYLHRGARRTRPRPRRARPGGRARRARLERGRRAARSTCSTCAPASPSRSPARPATSSPRAAFTRDGRALLVGNEGPTVPPTITRIALDAATDPATTATPHSVRGGDRAGSTGVTPLLPAAPREAGSSSTRSCTRSPARTGCR